MLTTNDAATELVIRNAHKLMLELHHKDVEPVHLLMGLLQQQGTSAYTVLKKAGVNYEKLYRYVKADGSIQSYVGQRRIGESNKACKAILDEAAVIAGNSANRHNRIKPSHLLLAILKTENRTVKTVLAKQSIIIPVLRADMKLAIRQEEGK